jgi:hypothetical protein
MKSLFALVMVISAIGAVSQSFAAQASQEFSTYGDQGALVNRVSNPSDNDKCPNPSDFHCPSANGG